MKATCAMIIKSGGMRHDCLINQFQSEIYLFAFFTICDLFSMIRTDVWSRQKIQIVVLLAHTIYERLAS